MRGFPQKTELTLCPCVYLVCERREGTAADVAVPRASWDNCSRGFWPEISVASSPDDLFSVWWSLWACRCRDCLLEVWNHQTSLTSIQTMSLQEWRVMHITGKVYSSESFLLRSCAVVGKGSLSFLWASEVEGWSHLTNMKGGSSGNKTILDFINGTPLLSWLRRDCFFLVPGSPTMWHSSVQLLCTLFTLPWRTLDPYCCFHRIGVSTQTISITQSSFFICYEATREFYVSELLRGFTALLSIHIWQGSSTNPGRGSVASVSTSKSGSVQLNHRLFFFWCFVILHSTCVQWHCSNSPASH